MGVHFALSRTENNVSQAHLPPNAAYGYVLLPWGIYVEYILGEEN